MTLRPGGRYAVQGLIVTGIPGELTVDGIIAPADSSHITVVGEWPTPPPILLDGLPAAVRDSLRAAWPTDETPTLQRTGRRRAPRRDDSSTGPRSL